jgi:uncharacterized protein YbjT (DUF2867 family)
MAKILITGATGKSGGETARRLAAGGHAFRVLVRDADRAAPLAELGAELAVGDIGDPGALAAAFDGIERGFLVMPNVQQQLELETGFIDAAVKAGVKHLAYLSSIESVPENTNPITQIHVAVERHLQASGLDWTLIRPSFFMQIFSGMAAGIRDHDQIVLPAGNGTIATTDLRDVAEILVKVLTEPGHENKRYDVTGPELLTLADCAERFSIVLGRTIRYVDQPLESFCRAPAQRRHAGMAGRCGEQGVRRDCRGADRSHNGNGRAIARPSSAFTRGFCRRSSRLVYALSDRRVTPARDSRPGKATDCRRLARCRNSRSASV